MRLPSLLRRTPFRLTLLFVALFAAAASAVLAYVYIASANEARSKTQADVTAEFEVLTGVYRERGSDALNAALVDRTIRGGPYLYMLMDPQGGLITGNLTETPIDIVPRDRGDGGTTPTWDTFTYTDNDASGRVTRPQSLGVQMRLSSGEILFVGESMGDTEAYLSRLTQALWAAMGIVLLLGLAGGLLVSRNLERAMGRLKAVVTAVQEGDLKARATVRATGDEWDELGQGLNTMLDRLEGRCRPSATRATPSPTTCARP